MNLFSFLRPKWKDPNPRKRLAAIERLDDQDVLAELAENDESSEVRLAAINKLTDPAVLAQIAKGRSEQNLAALARITYQPFIADIARSAESPDVRGAAVGRLEDRELLRLISEQDGSARVRLYARMKLVGPGSLYDFLKTSLAQLQVAEDLAASAAATCRDLDGICDSLINDRRFRIDGVLGEDVEIAELDEMPPVSPPPVAEPDRTSGPARDRIELLARKHESETETLTGMALTSYYHITVRRLGENAFDYSMEEKLAKLDSEPRPPIEVSTGNSNPIGVARQL